MVLLERSVAAVEQHYVEMHMLESVYSSTMEFGSWPKCCGGVARCFLFLLSCFFLPTYFFLSTYLFFPLSPSYLLFRSKHLLICCANRPPLIFRPQFSHVKYVLVSLFFNFILSCLYISLLAPCFSTKNAYGCCTILVTVLQLEYSSNVWFLMIFWIMSSNMLSACLC